MSVPIKLDSAVTAVEPDSAKTLEELMRKFRELRGRSPKSSELDAVAKMIAKALEEVRAENQGRRARMGISGRANRRTRTAP